MLRTSERVGDGNCRTEGRCGLNVIRSEPVEDCYPQISLVTGSRTPEDMQIHRCLSCLYKIVLYCM